MFSVFTISFVCWTFFQKGITGQDPCRTIRILGNPTRSILYTLGSKEPDKCDRLIPEGWYKVAENGTIPLRCPEILHCGSLAPIWLNDTLPAVGEQRSMKACLRGFIKCCPIHFKIDVRNCGGFLVYHLTSPPACPGRYCIDGPAAPCAEGTSSESGFEPCEKTTIEFDVSVSVEPFIPTRDYLSELNKLAFRCKESGMKQQYQGYLFDYIWYVDQKEVYTKERIGFEGLENGRVLYLHEWDPDGKKKLGFQIYCAVRARENNDSIPTLYISSEEFFAGAVVTKTSTRITSGEKAILKIKSTVPVACKDIPGRKTDCVVLIEMFSLKDQFKTQPAHCNVSVDEIKASSCGIDFNGNKWDVPHDFELKTLKDTSSRPAYTCTAKLISRSLDSLWNNYELPEVKLHVIGKKRPKGGCSSVNDPHVYTVDGQYVLINDKGEFKLYRHQTKPIDIHTIHKWEGGGSNDAGRRYAYNCAIMIKASDDMFVIYGCDVPPRWIVRRLNCDSNHEFLEVFERGKDYEIVLPTGTSINVKIKSNHWLNININYSPNDWDQTEGLCGTYNGKKEDDFIDKETWKIPYTESLFRAKTRKEKLENEVLYCSCLAKSALRDEKNIADCQWQESLPTCKPLMWKETKCHTYGRTKREIDDDLEFDVALDVVEFKESKTVFGWKNGWTEEKAVNACKSFAERSKLYHKCSTLSNIQSDTDLKTCVADIKLSGSNMYLVGSLDRMKAACINEIRTNTSFWVPKPVITTTTAIPSTTKGIKKTSDKPLPKTTNSTTTTEKPDEFDADDFLDNFDTSGFLADFAEEVFEIDCPNSCSEAGECNEGVCTCNEGFGGDDCSLDMRKNLELYGVSKESFCDISKRACSHVSVFSAEFFESDTILCLMKDAELMDSKQITPRTLNTTSDGSLRSFSEVRCPIGELSNMMITTNNRTEVFPILDYYLISVSLDGERFSTESPIILYDSTCTDCQFKNGEVYCKTRDDICIVNKKCFKEEHKICKKKEEEETKENVSYALIGYSLGGLSLVILPALFFYKRYKASRRSIKFYQKEMVDGLAATQIDT